MKFETIPRTTRDRNIDAIRNGIRQIVASEGRQQAQRSARSPIGDLQKILVDCPRIRPPIESSTDLLNQPLAPIGV